MPYIDGIFYELDKVNKTATICKIAKTNSNTDITIPPRVRDCKVVRIANGAFMQAKYLETISLPDTIDMIGKHAFKECSKLTSVKLSSRHIKIGECAFHNCFRLQEVSTTGWGTTIYTVGYGAFLWCENVRFYGIDFGGNVHCETFNYCKELTELHFAHNVVLKTGAIKNCKNLTTIYVDGKLEAAKPMQKKLRQYKLVCNELSSVLDWVYYGYNIEFEDDCLPF